MHTPRLSSLIVLALVLSPVAFACSACVRDIISEEEFDQRSWDNATHVFVAIVTKAEINQPIAPNGYNRVDYQYAVEEVLKGEGRTDLAVYTDRSIEQWNSEIVLIGCGDIALSPGDRLLIFAEDEPEVYIGRCSATRVIESIIQGPDPSIESTLRRIRAWAR